MTTKGQGARAAPRSGGRRTERGAVTAEAALVLPAIAALTVGMTWMVSLGIAQVRVVDAARESARMAARGDPVATAIGTGRRVGGEGARVSLTRDDAEVVATAIVRVRGPGGLFAFLPPVTVRARAVAATEPDGDGP